MAYNIKFVKGLASEYTSLQVKDENTLYFTTDDGALYLGTKKFTSGDQLALAITNIATNTSDIEEIQEKLKTLLGEDGEGNGSSIQDMIQDAVEDLEKEIQDQIGDMEDLETDADTLVDAINEVKENLDQAIEDLTVEIDDDAEAGIYSKVYTIKQGGEEIGTINIPKDMVVSHGEVVDLEEDEVPGKDAGKYIKLDIANGETLYIPVGSLVDIYKGSGDAGMTGQKVRVTVNQKTRVIEAFLEAGSVGTNEIIDGAVTGKKIAEGTITSANLSEELQTIVEGIKEAVVDVEEGENNGTINVTVADGEGDTETKEVKVHGLKSAAYVDANSFDPEGSAATAEQNSKDYTDAALTWGTIV